MVSRFSALVRDKSLCTSWQKKMAAKREKDLLKQYSSQLKQEKARQKEVQWAEARPPALFSVQRLHLCTYCVSPTVTGKEEKERREFEASCRE